ncbi:uncharacterized protein LOC104265698 [Ciona intestinalis]
MRRYRQLLNSLLVLGVLTFIGINWKYKNQKQLNVSFNQKNINAGSMVKWNYGGILALEKQIKKQTRSYNVDKAVCTLKLNKDIPTTYKPRIKLDPNKFLLPFLIWGPNNQLIGLRDSIFVAIKLNRTLVIPRFFTHYKDTGAEKESVVHAANRVDLEYLARFVSLVTLEHFQNKCQRKIEVVFQNRPVVCSTLIAAERATGTDILGSKYTPGVEGKLTIKKSDPRCKPDISAYPHKVDDNTKHEVRNLKAIFNSTAKCVIFLSPFQSLSVSSTYGRMHHDHYDIPNIAKLTTTNSVETADPYKLMAAIEHETRRPPYVVKIATEFLHDVMANNSFVAVHWRYDKELVSILCLSKPSDPICNNSVTPGHLAVGISKVLEEIAPLHQTKNTAPFVYIASPPKLKDFVTQVKSSLSTKHYYRDLGSQLTPVLTTADLKKYLDAKYPRQACKDLRPTDNEFLSLIEMEICSASVAFIGSQFSSWTAVIQHYRPEKYFKFDRSVYDVIF